MLTMTCPRCWGAGREPARRTAAAMLWARRHGDACARCFGSGESADRQLSPHFLLSEFVGSQLAAARGIPNDPSAAVEEQLVELTSALEPIRAAFGPVLVTSGYRSEELNAAIGGAKTSAHRYGAFGSAVDFKVRASPAEVIAWVGANLPSFDQAIDEPGWTHLGLFGAKGVQRRELLRMRRGPTGAPAYTRIA